MIPIRGINQPPYIGPENTLHRFLDGEIITRTDLLTDESLWVVVEIAPKAHQRLMWMIENLDHDNGKIVRIRP